MGRKGAYTLSSLRLIRLSPCAYPCLATRPHLRNGYVKMPSSWIDVLETVVHFVLRPVFTETLLGTAVEKWSGN